MDMLTHLKSRGVDPEQYQFSYDEETACFYLFNLTTQIVGYIQYRPSADKKRKNDPKMGRYYTYCKDKLGVWGLETYYWNPRILFITEGIFDAVKLHNQRLPAIAALSNDPKHIKSWIRIIKTNKLIVGIGDNDPAGRKLRNICDISFELDEHNDLGDMTNSEVKEWLSRNRVLSLI